MKYYIGESGHGKFKHPAIKLVSDREAKRLEDNGEEIFKSRKEALQALERKRR